jgi:hypothetical protein
MTLFRAIIVSLLTLRRNLDNSVDIATGYKLDDRVYIRGKSKIFFSAPQYPDRPCGPPSVLHNEYGGKSAGAVKLTSHLYIVPR